MPYCKHCGYHASSVSALTVASCFRHPNGPNKGKHELYEGAEKHEYVCKYCGYKSHSISALTAARCFRHPSGANKGSHAPAL